MKIDIRKVKCPKCGKKTIEDNLYVEPEPKEYTLEAWIQENKYVSTNYGQVFVTAGTSRGEVRKITCMSCGYTKNYNRVVYT